ncbi:PREDICTED: 39S ribosomal protein L52, mitochondrial-like [Branchiostoma belcheri]|uniref:Large ribosomal subunit protein mL52 n=1 Tax=Branchiostoma belcheri TaxID=7741 RepID=A0A6P4ZJD2_BRABE|nr:PREDICTED: 39S ribosomal protein L52, mitochondrial-like [Branchiostoma belcheri]
MAAWRSVACVLRAKMRESWTFGAQSPHINRCLSTSAHLCSGETWRQSYGLPPQKNEYGPLTDLPDWTFADGRPAPMGTRQLKRLKERKELAARIVSLLEEVEEGKQGYLQKIEQEAEKVAEKERRRLKPKGKQLLQKSKQKHKNESI